MSSPVFICASSYGARFTKAHGQARCARIAAKANAQGIEIRQELLTAKDEPLTTLGATIEELQLDCHYSTTELVWLGDRLNDNLHTSIKDAIALKASLLKVAIGSLPQDDSVRTATLATLGEWLEGSGLTLALENDQTPSGGNPDALLGAHQACRQAGIDTILTFDIGNWEHVGVNAIDAARDVGSKVGYVHCKGTRREGNELHAAPPSPVELSEWSTLWSSFPKGIPRAIEFPLSEEDDPAIEDAPLCEASARWVSRLSHL